MAIVMGPTGLQFSDGTNLSGPNTDTGSLISITTFTSSGTYTVPSGCGTIYVKVQGGGGGSAGYCESGGAGGYAESFVKVAPAGLTPGSSTISVTVGGGGGGVGYYAGAGGGGPCCRPSATQTLGRDARRLGCWFGPGLAGALTGIRCRVWTVLVDGVVGGVLVRRQQL